MPGSIRVVNKRKEADPRHQVELHETLINIDLGNSPLANRYRLSATMTRNQAIGFFKQDLDKDINRRGPMYQECLAIAQLVLNGHDIALGCWCKPLRCHGDAVVEQVLKLLQKIKN